MYRWWKLRAKIVNFQVLVENQKKNKDQEKNLVCKTLLNKRFEIYLTKSWNTHTRQSNVSYCRGKILFVGNAGKEKWSQPFLLRFLKYFHHYDERKFKNSTGRKVLLLNIKLSRRLKENDRSFVIFRIYFWFSPICCICQCYRVFSVARISKSAQVSFKFILWLSPIFEK